MSKKANKKNPKQTNKKNPEEVANLLVGGINDVDLEETKKRMRFEARSLMQDMIEEKKQADMQQMERERINYFWVVEKKRMEDLSAEMRNKLRELEDLKEKHQIEVKIQKQRVKHLLYQNQDQLIDLKKDQETSLKIHEDKHRIQERELKSDRINLNQCVKELEISHENYLRSLNKEHDKNRKNQRTEFEREASELRTKYLTTMKKVRDKLEDDRKRITKQIEEKKNNTLTELNNKHAKKFADIKNFYTEITSTNLDIIQNLKTKVQEFKKYESEDLKKLLDIESKNKSQSDPLKKYTEEVKNLKTELKKQKEDKDELDKTKQKILQAEKDLKKEQWEWEVLSQRLSYDKKELGDLENKYNNSLQDLQQKIGLENLILEKKYESIEEAIENKDVQLNQILTAANLDPRSLGAVTSSIEEVEMTKNEQINEVQAELKKIREAHSNMVKTYESKLSEFGIPVEELGFDPLVPANI